MILARYIYRRRFLRPQTTPERIGTAMIKTIDKIINLWRL
jgi:hypothetical protein